MDDGSFHEVGRLTGNATYESGKVQSVILPHETRDYLIRTLEVHRLRLTHGVGKHLMHTWPSTY